MGPLKPYPSMKGSGSPMLGDIPEHWDVSPIARIGSLFKGNGGSKEDEVATGLPCVRYGDLYTRHEFFIQSTKACISSDRAPAYMPIKYGDLIFAASGETIEDIGRSAVNLLNQPAYCGGDTLILRPSVPINPRFLGYVADSPPARHQKASMGRGFTVVHIYASQLKRLTLPLPPLDEQAAIVRFLDHVDRKIRRFIQVKRRLIELLNEQKQAIINQAVTRGLNPDVPLKPSGVGWIGNTPESWDVRPIKHVSKIVRGKFTHRPRNDPAFYNGPYPFIQTGDVARADRVVDSYRQTLNERGLAVSKMFPCGTLLMTIAANIGDVAILGIDACFPDSIVGFLPASSINRDYLYFVFRSMKAELVSEAPVNTQGNLNIDRIGWMPIPVPPMNEQENIVRFINDRTFDLDNAISINHKEVSLIREYRTRLIADVVTGKLDVREAAEHLPLEMDQDDAEVEPLDFDETEEVDDEAAELLSVVDDEG